MFQLHIYGYASADTSTNKVPERIKRMTIRELRRLVGKHATVQWKEYAPYPTTNSNWTRPGTLRQFVAIAQTKNRTLRIPEPVPRIWSLQEYHGRRPDIYTGHKEPWRPQTRIVTKDGYIFGHVTRADYGKFYMKVPAFEYLWERDL